MAITIDLHEYADLKDENGVLLANGAYDYVALVGPPGAQSAIDPSTLDSNSVTLTDGQGTINVSAASTEHTVIFDDGVDGLYQNTHTSSADV